MQNDVAHRIGNFEFLFEGEHRFVHLGFAHNLDVGFFQNEVFAARERLCAPVGIKARFRTHHGMNDQNAAAYFRRSFFDRKRSFAVHAFREIGFDGVGKFRAALGLFHRAVRREVSHAEQRLSAVTELIRRYLFPREDGLRRDGKHFDDFFRRKRGFTFYLGLA